MQSRNAVAVTMLHQTVPGHLLAWQVLRFKHGHLNVACFGHGSENHIYGE